MLIWVRMLVTFVTDAKRGADRRKRGREDQPSPMPASREEEVEDSLGAHAGSFYPGAVAQRSGSGPPLNVLVGRRFQDPLLA